MNKYVLKKDLAQTSHSTCLENSVIANKLIISSKPSITSSTIHTEKEDQRHLLQHLNLCMY